MLSANEIFTDSHIIINVEIKVSNFWHSCWDTVLSINSQCEDEYKVNYFNWNKSFIAGIVNKNILAKWETIFDWSIPFSPWIMKRELINTYDPSDVVTITTTVSYNIHYYLKKITIALIFVMFFGWIIFNTRKRNKI